MKSWGHFIKRRFIEDIKYLNTTLEEYTFIYHYGTSNYTKKVDFDSFLKVNFSKKERQVFRYRNSQPENVVDLFFFSLPISPLLFL